MTELGADIYAKDDDDDDDGRTPLHWLRTTGLFDVVRRTTEGTHDAKANDGRIWRGESS